MKDEIEEDLVEDSKEEENEEEFEISYDSPNKEDMLFDQVVGALQEVVIDPAFTAFTSKFMDQYCVNFDEKEENKLVYNEIFKKYVQTVEATLEKELAKRIPGFSMDKFIALLEKRKEQIDDGLLDTLLSFNDFLLFKDIMLSHKKAKFAPKGEGLGISGTKYTIHKEEQSDGEEMPDLKPDVIPLTPLIMKKKKP